MPELRLVPLSEIFSASQLTMLRRQLADVGIDGVPEGEDDDLELEDALTDDQMTDFMDRLDAHDVACDLYLPVEFDATFSVEDHRVGSAYALLDTLEELRTELEIDEEGVADDEDEIDMEVIEEQIRLAWQTFVRAANTCVDKQVPLHVITE